jgi:hypothetical protein
MGVQNKFIAGLLREIMSSWLNAIVTFDNYQVRDTLSVAQRLRGPVFR